jgi:hypothetical protein
MISDGDLYRLAIFLGSCAMMMIVLYHFLDVNARDDQEESTDSTSAKPARATVKATSTTSSESTTTSAPATGNAL